MNIFRLIQRDHQEIDSLLSRLQLAPGEADFDGAGRRYLVDRLLSVASRHEAAEELALWPYVRRALPDGAEMAGHGLEGERDAKAVLELLRATTSEEDIAGTCAELHALIRAHAAFEEETVFPRIRSRTTRVWAALAGFRFRAARRAGPTRPHYRGPDRPLGLLTRGAPTAMFDHLRDLGKRQRRHPVGFEAPDRADAVAVIEAGHCRIEALLSQAEVQEDVDDRLLQRLIREIAVHDAMERQYLYPVIRRRLPDGNARYDKMMSEHGRVGLLAAKLDIYRFHDEARATWVHELIISTRTHIAEEEASVLPPLAARMTREELVDLGDRLERASKKAPTRPHPHMAGAGAGGRLSSLLTRPIDKARDALAGRRAQ